MIEVTYSDLAEASDSLARRWRGSGVRAVYGVPRGGCVPAVMVAARLGLPLAEEPTPGVLVVDDLVDSGRTAARYDGLPFDALFRKSHTPVTVAPLATDLPGWLVFPWERGTADHAGPADAVVRLLEHVGEDPNRAGLVDTPGRVLRALTEMTSGYALDPADLLARQFPDDYDELVVVRGVEFTSLCEHHLLAFTGTATVGYVPTPGRGVVGLSKLARLVDVFAHRLQVQERMTSQIAQAIADHLEPVGVGVVVSARHSCMACRGVRKAGAEMVTSAMLGALRTDPALRGEFLALAS